MKNTRLFTLTIAFISLFFMSMIPFLSDPSSVKPSIDNEITQSLRKKLNTYINHIPEDKIFIKTDKTLYQTGETIWLSAFIRNGVDLLPSKKSDIVYIELVGPKGNIERSHKIIAAKGIAAGDILLSDNLPGGLYKLRGYTRWMKNEPSPNFFEKDIQIQDFVLPNLKMKLEFDKKAYGPSDHITAKFIVTTNENKPLKNKSFEFVTSLNGVKSKTTPVVTDEEGYAFLKFSLPENLHSNDGLINVTIPFEGTVESISRSIPITLKKIKIDFFPEGGDMLAGFKNNLAIKAVNEFGKPADVDGEILDSEGNRICSFSTFHNGMGNTEFTPVADEDYHAIITRPAGIQTEYEIPQAVEEGHALKIQKSANNIDVTVNSTHREKLSLIGQVRGAVYYSTVLDAQSGENNFKIDGSVFPAGVLQLTLFDSKGIPLSERLIFTNKDNLPNVSISTDKEKYNTREKVRASIKVTDKNNQPLRGRFSVAVVNDQLLNFADDKQSTLLTSMLLESDLNEKVEDPAFYFSNNKKADQALDLLMMTSGWRRFSWRNIDELPQILHAKEKAILSGKIIDASTGKPVEQAEITINDGRKVKAGRDGKFRLSRILLYTPHNLKFTAPGYYTQQKTYSEYSEDFIVYLYKQNKQKTDYRSDHSHAVPRSRTMNDALVPSVAEREASAAEPIREFAGQKSGFAREKSEAKEEVKIQNNGDVFDKLERRNNKDTIEEGIQIGRYYKAREFPKRNYIKDETPTERTDFRNTIYWSPSIILNDKGEATVEFFTSDEITSFNINVEGVGSKGEIFSGTKLFYSQLPFEMKVKLPVEVVQEDKLFIPLVIKNNTDGPLGGALTISAGAGLKPLALIDVAQTIMPGKSKTLFLEYLVTGHTEFSTISVMFKACGLQDAFKKDIRIIKKGFPASASFSGQHQEKEYSLEIKNLVKGSLKARLIAYPDVVSDLMQGVAGILREPYGCFEQTSCTAYPNAMVLDYLKSTGSKDDKTISYAKDLLNRGYKRLTTFETKGGGYEWFGAAPAHEGLTAYGIMEFTDMKNAGGDIDDQMLRRTTSWLLSQRDGKGGFNREAHAYHDFGRVDTKILNAYIVYALSEAGVKDLKPEFDASYAEAITTKDPYLLALMGIGASNLEYEQQTKKITDQLIAAQQGDGSWNGKLHSITVSGGQSLKIETTSLAVLALLRTKAHMSEITKAVQFLVSSRSGSGVFGSTQGTILCLKALTEVAKSMKKTKEGGTIEFWVNGKKATEKKYSPGEKEILLENLEEYITASGKYDFSIKFKGTKTPLPYSMDVTWNTSVPESDEESVITIKNKIQENKIRQGETVRLQTEVMNTSANEVPSTIAVIGIPAGLTLQPWQLKELQEKKVFDYYEVKGNTLAIYYRGLPGKAVKQINLDLKSEVAGEFEAPASCAYLYYTNEFKSWCSTGKIFIAKN